MIGADHMRVTSVPLVNTGLLLLKTGALVMGLEASDVLRIRAPLKHAESPLPPRQLARLTLEFESLIPGAPAVGVGAAPGDGVGPLGVLPQAINPATAAAAESLSSNWTSEEFFIGATGRRTRVVDVRPVSEQLRPRSIDRERGK